MKKYIGDGVYVQWSQGNLILTTENGFKTTNTIVLEYELIQNLKEYLGCCNPHYSR